MKLTMLLPVLFVCLLGLQVTSFAEDTNEDAPVDLGPSKNKSGTFEIPDFLADGPPSSGSSNSSSTNSSSTSASATSGSGSTIGNIFGTPSGSITDVSSADSSSDLPASVTGFLDTMDECLKKYGEKICTQALDNISGGRGGSGRGAVAQQQSSNDYMMNLIFSMMGQNGGGFGGLEVPTIPWEMDPVSIAPVSIAEETPSRR